MFWLNKITYYYMNVVGIYTNQTTLKHNMEVRF